MAYEAPQFIQFQYIIRLGGHHSSRQRRHIQGFFFSQAVTVLRDTPKGPAQPAQAAAFCIGAQNSAPLSR